MILLPLIIGVTLLSSTSYANAVSPPNSKIRRGGNAGLFPFPRVGRSQPDKTWLVPPRLQEYQMMLKRQGLMPFPRVGRSSPEGNSQSGMWFGPRLGRSSKRSMLYDYNDFIDLPNPGEFTPRLGRELENELSFGNLPSRLQRELDSEINFSNPGDFTPRLGRELDGENPEDFTEAEQKANHQK